MNIPSRFSRGLVRFAALSVLLAGASLHAMPPRQRLLTGVVQSFDPQTQMLTLASVRPGLPTTVAIRPPRTRLRADGQPATLPQLPSTGPVRIYYRTEMGQPVATEVSWRSAAKNS